MRLMNTFLLTVNGLFDFDLTFPLEALSFAILSGVLTIFFLNPISNQLEKREIFLEYNLKKSLIFFNLGYEQLLNCVELISDEITELERQTIKFKQIATESFDQELVKLQKDSLKIIGESKGEMKIRSSFLFSTFIPEISKITDQFFEQKTKTN